MENQSTPIENLMHIDDNTTDGSNLSTSAQVLQKYNELENGPMHQTEERAQINTGTEQRQLDPAIANQHRMMELERARQYQMQYQQQHPPPVQQEPPKKGFMDNFKNMTNGLSGKMIGPLIIVVLFVLFNLGVVDKTLMKLIPKVANDYGHINMKGVILKALIVGILFFVIRMFI